MKRVIVVLAFLISLVMTMYAQPVANLNVIGGASATEACFDQKSLAGPFPSDWFTVPDLRQLTGVRVNLPKPNCAEFKSDCEDIDVINELDGFNVQPRLSIPFSGPIDLSTVPRGVFLIRLESTVSSGEPGRQVIEIDQVVFEPSTNTLYIEPDEVLDQHTRYLLVITKDVTGGDGKKVKAAKAFLNFVDDLITESTGDAALDSYRTQLRNALDQVDGTVLPRGQVVAASVFTTQSATAVLEKIRDQIHAARPEPADFLLGLANHERTVFGMDQVTGITWSQEISVGVLKPVSVDLSVLRKTYPGAVGSIAFGKYLSPDYQLHPGEYIPQIGTRADTPIAQGPPKEIYFNLFLPSGTKPVDGWPVVIVGHGITKDKNTFPLNVASSMAQHGIATIAINVVGHGYGSQGTLTVSRNNGGPLTFYAGGRGIDQDGSGTIDNIEGVTAYKPKSVVFFSDAYRQTAADLMQLVRVIEVGMDVDGDGQRELDPSRIYFFGSSLGGGYGTVFVSVEPHVRAAAFAAPVDPVAIGTWSCQYRISEGALWATREPPLLNSPGISSFDACILNPPVFLFDDNLPLKNKIPLTVQLSDGTTRTIKSPVTNTVPGATEIQAAGENLKWVGEAGSPLAYAAHLRKAPLSGMQNKPVLFLIAKGDRSAPNPTTTAILRAGELVDSTVYYRHDLYRAKHAGVPQNPHGFAVSPGDTKGWSPISLSVQNMFAEFFLSDGSDLAVPEQSDYFEVPIVLPLPEDLNYVP